MYFLHLLSTDTDAPHLLILNVFKKLVFHEYTLLIILEKNRMNRMFLCLLLEESFNEANIYCSKIFSDDGKKALLTIRNCILNKSHL